MNKALILAAPLVVLAACAAPGGPAANAKMAAASSGATQYCKKDRLLASASELTCTWSPSASDACENTNLSTLGRASVAAEPANAGRCGNGQWLVSVTTR